MSGLPLLSGPPPSGPESEACRKCGKEFNILFSRSRKCNHCGFHYCHSCSDYQALMPRRGPENGYVATNVCGYCIEHLNITAGGKNQLKSLPIGRLRKYANAYDIRIDRAVEKDDIIDAIVAARGPNGCLPPPKEDYYRRHSVPVTEPRSGLRNLFRGSPPPAPPSPPPPPPHRRPTFARPDLEPDPPRDNDRPPPPPPRPSQPQYQYAPPPGPPPPPTQYQGHYGTPYTYSSPQPHPSPNQYPPPQSYYEGPYGPPPNPPPRPHSSWENTSHPGGYPPFNGPPGYGYQQGGYVPQSYGTSPPPPPPPPPQSTRPAPQTAPSPPPPPPPPRPQPQQQSSSRPQPTHRSSAPPTLDALLDMSSDGIASLSISALKQILFTNHVNAGQVLEKGELVKKVVTLVEDEKRERERQRRVLEMEEMERLQMEQERLEEQERERERRRERERVAEEQERRARETEAGERRARERETEERRNRGTGGSGAGSQTRIHIVNLGPVSEDGMSEYGGEDEDRSPFTEHATSGPSPAQPRAEPFSQRSTTPKPSPQPSFKPSTMDRTGLCVVCQDEEANIAIIDCG